MKLRIFSVVGEVLNFGGRRIGTTMRIAWLPIVLLLIVNMATVFAYLSVVAGRVITFAEVGTFFTAQQLVGRYAADGWSSNPIAMTAITGLSFIFQYILISSFMAPLIRYSGLGEKPAPGVMRLAFGPDQLRYMFSNFFSILFSYLVILAPIIVASLFVMKYLVDAVSKTMVSFPDPNSLHTIKLVTAGDDLAARGVEWIYAFAIPLGAVAPVAILIWAIAFLHFHPRNRPNANGDTNPIMRALVTLGAVTIVAGGAFYFLREQILHYLKSAASLGAEGAVDISGAPVNAILFFGIAGYILFGYFSLRLYPYPGVAVCRSSLALGGTLGLSRGWNLIRLQIILFAVPVLLTTLFVIINLGFLSMLMPQVIGLLYEATAVSTRLVNSGVEGGWVLPLFIWIWTIIKMLVTIVWSFFYYGVLAGLYGRLYRDSERAETSA